MCSNLIVFHEIIIIHSLWKENYTPLLKVIPSLIKAGDIGALYHQNHSKILRVFKKHRLDYLTYAFSLVISNNS